LTSRNGRPRKPIRSCTKNGVDRRLKVTPTAKIATIGVAMIANIVPARRSKTRLRSAHMLDAFRPGSARQIHEVSPILLRAPEVALERTPTT
jgi:hypothetical protein